MEIREYLSNFGIHCKQRDSLYGIGNDSRTIQKNELFICYSSQYARDYIRMALSKEAYVLTDEPLQGERIYYCRDLKKHEKRLCEYFYGNVCEGLYVIGVTGTNGKTSTASLIAQFLELNHVKYMQMGTHFIKWNQKEIKTEHTTVDRFRLANYFTIAKKEGCQVVVMEVSSHAIAQKRIIDLSFDQIIYTNISEDHLDFHKNRANYIQTKLSLMNYVKDRGCVLYNRDDEILRYACDSCKKRVYSFGYQGSDFCISDVCLSQQGTRFCLNEAEIKLSLLSKMNVYNTVAAMTSLYVLGYSMESLIKQCCDLHPNSGRLEVIYNQRFQVWIDYAHTVEAFKQLLQFACSVRTHRLLVICGCGGEREQQKRAKIGEFVAKYSDFAIFTCDNPRNEKIHEIIQQMLPKNHENVRIFENRRCAIKHCIKNAENSDIIIIAGKGCEQSIERNGKKYPFDDREIVQAMID